MKPFSRFSNFSIPNCFFVFLLFSILVISSGCDVQQGLTVGQKPPEISGTDITGEFVSLKQFKGNVVILYFWRNTCCADRLKLLEPYFDRFRDKGLTILAINGGDSKETVESFSKKNVLTFTMQTDERGMISREYGIYGYPTIFILDRTGTIQKKILGEIDIVQLEKLVSRYL